MIRATAMAAVLGLALAAIPARAATVQVDIGGMTFAAPTAALHVGDVVEWSNRDYVAHTVTARDGSFDLMIPPGKTGRITLRQAGNEPFFCRFHPNMQGSLAVAP